MFAETNEVEPVVGIIGGLGPLAGAWFYKRLVELTPAKGDEEHLSVILRSDPTIPSRIEHLTGSGSSPVPALIRVARGLVDAGATFLVIPSSTTHAYYEVLQQAVERPILNLPIEVAAYMRNHGYVRVGLLVTEATIHTGVYLGVSSEEFVPIFGDDVARKRLQDIIVAVKSGGDRKQATATLEELVIDPCWAECDAIVLGCTELAVLGPISANIPIVSADDVLALAVLESVGRMR